MHASFDLDQGRIQGGVRTGSESHHEAAPALTRVDEELPALLFRDAAEGAAEQVGEGPGVSNAGRDYPEFRV